MTTASVQRVRFYNGQYLRARDFEDLVAYLLALVRRHSALAHTWGIGWGLGLTGFKPGTEQPADEGDRDLYLQEGVFLDRFGRTGVLVARTDLSLVARSRGLLAGDYQVWVLYDQASQASAGRAKGLCEGAAEDRVTESVKVRFIPNTIDRALDTEEPLTTDDPYVTYTPVAPPPDDPSAESPVFVGTATWDGGAYFTAHSLEGRRYAGISAEEVRAPSGLARIRLGALPAGAGASPVSTSSPGSSGAGAAGAEESTGSPAASGPKAGQFVLSLAAGEAMVDRVWIDAAGRLWFDAAQVTIGMTDEDGKNFKPCLTVRFDEGQCVVDVAGDLVLSGELSFFDSQNTTSTLKGFDTRIRALEALVSQQGAGDFLRYLTPQLAGVLVRSAVTSSGIAMAAATQARTPTRITGSKLIGITGRNPGELSDQVLDDFTSGFDTSAGRLEALRRESVVNPARLTELGLSVTPDRDQLISAARDAGLSEADADKQAAYATLYQVLVTLTRLLAPFVPHVASEIWEQLGHREPG